MKTKLLLAFLLMSFAATAQYTLVQGVNFVEAPADGTVECSAIPSPAILTVADNCGTNPTVTFSEIIQYGNYPGNYKLTATDASGNSKSQKSIVQSTTAPVFTSEIPTELSVSCDNIPTAEIMTAVAGCGSATVKLVETKTAGSCPGEYSLNRTWTATDSCGNSTSFTQTINVSDTIPPAIQGTFQNIITVDCDNIPPIPQLKFSDNCSGLGEIIAPLSADNIINKTDDSYTIIRSWKVSDLCGNTSTFIQTINVLIKDVICTALNISNGNMTFNLNNLIPQEYAGIGIWTDLSSSGGLKGNNDGIFSAFGMPAGSYTMEYGINDPVCPIRIQIIVNVANAKWSNKNDAIASITNCSALHTEAIAFEKMSIYPNPSKGELHIDNVTLEKATVYDASGKLVESACFDKSSDKNILNLNGLDKGVYFLFIQSEGAHTAEKIIIE